MKKAVTEYRYTTILGKAVLCRGDDLPLIFIGQFKSEKEAVEACERHYEKAKKATARLGFDLPKPIYA